jgi:hypothetical protein
MDVNRRNLMKGILAGGTLATLGIPRFTTATPGIAPAPDFVKARTCALLLGNTSVDDAFANGVSAAYSVYSAGLGNVSAQPTTLALDVVKLKSGLLVEVGRVSELLAISRGMRWVAVMDDASAAVFTEIVRAAGGRLLSRGTHVSSRNVSAYPAFQSDCPPLLRHLWASTSSEQSSGVMLASQLVRHHQSFSIVENFLREARSSGKASVENYRYGVLTRGFRSYASTGPLAMHLHCSGVSASEGCGLLGWDTSQKWTELTSLEDGDEATQTVQETWHPANWVEALGYAVTLVGLGIGTLPEDCVKRGFMHRALQGEWPNMDEPIFSEERFTSFIVEV